MSAREAILLSKLGKKKVPSTDVVPEQDIDSIKEIRSNGFAGADLGGAKSSAPSSSLDILKKQKAMGIGEAYPIRTAGPFGSINEMEESEVPTTSPSYSPIKKYLKKGK